MDVTVATVHEPSCFVSVPQDFLRLVYEGDFELPLVLELATTTKGDSAKHYAVWGGASGAASHIEVPNALAECMGISDGERVKLRAYAQVPYAVTVEVEPATEDDWEILELNQGYLEEQILNQVAVVKEGAVVPVWLHGKDRLLLRVVKALPLPLVRLMTGVELIVAPKERAKKQPSNKTMLSSTEQHPGVWLRVQDLRSNRFCDVKLGDYWFSSSITTKAFISPLTARDAKFCDGQLAFLSAEKAQENSMAKTANSISSTSNGTTNEMHDVDRGSGLGSEASTASRENDRSERVAIVRLHVSRSVARGHVMLAYHLRQQLGVKMMTRVLLQHCPSKPIAEPGQITVHPLVLSPKENNMPVNGDHPSADVQGSWQKPMESNHSEPQPQHTRATAFHRYLMSQALDVSPGESAHSGSKSNGVQANGTSSRPAKGTGKEGAWPPSLYSREAMEQLLNKWVLAHTPIRNESLQSTEETGVPVTDGTLMHFSVPIVPKSEGLAASVEMLSTKGAESSNSTREVEGPRRDCTQGEEVLFVIRLSSKDQGSRDGRFKEGGEVPPFIMLSPGEEGASLARSLQVGRPCVWGPTEDAGDNAKWPTLESLGWLASPAKQALTGLNSVLSLKAKRLQGKLGTPCPGSVLLHGPQASGKTRLARAIAAHLREDPCCLAHSVFVSCTELAGEQPGVATVLLRSAIEEAVDCAPSIVILDDIDVLLPAAEQDGGPSGPSVSGQAPLVEYLADIMDSCQAAATEAMQSPSWRSRFSSVAFLGVARSPSSIAKQLHASGRFDSHVELPSPAEAERAEILAGYVASRHLHCLPEVLSKAAARCTGFDVSDLDIVVERALHAAAVRHLGTASASVAAATVATSLPPQHPPFLAALRMALPRVELAHEDFATALEGFVPVAMRGIGTKTSSVDGPQRGWDDVGGLEEARRALQEVLELPAKHAKLFSSAPLRLRSGVLLYGPPGCGKTHIVGAAAAACGLRFISVKGPELLNKYIGASEQAVRDVFARAGAASPCMLFFDEFDAIAPKRGHDNTGVTDRVVNQLLTELDGVEALTGVFVIAATSRPDLIDAALLRPGRLDQLLICDFPTLDERREILRALARQLRMGEDADLNRIAAFTDGFSGADLQALLSDAQLAAVHEALDAPSDESAGELTVSIAAWHLESALRTARPSVPETERLRLRSIYDQFHASRTASTASVSQQAKGKRATLA